MPHGAAAAGMLGGDEETYRELLQSIVDVARTIFGAEAASVFIYDEEADELVFEAVSGQGEGDLVGARFPSSTGIAGFALVTRQPLVVDDLQNDPRFSRERAGLDGIRADEHRRVAAAPRRARARRALRARPRPRPALRARGARSPLAVLDPGGDRARPAPQRAPRARASLGGDGDGGLVARVAALARRRGRGRRPRACSRRSSASSASRDRRIGAAQRERRPVGRRSFRLRRPPAGGPASMPVRSASCFTGPSRGSTSCGPEVVVLDASTSDCRGAGSTCSWCPSKSLGLELRAPRHSSMLRLHAISSDTVFSFRRRAWWTTHPPDARAGAEIFPHFWCGAQTCRPTRGAHREREGARAPRCARSARSGEPRASPAPARLGRLDPRRLGVSRRARRLRLRAGRRGGGRARRPDPAASPARSSRRSRRRSSTASRASRVMVVERRRPIRAHGRGRRSSSRRRACAGRLRARRAHDDRPARSSVRRRPRCCRRSSPRLPS